MYKGGRERENYGCIEMYTDMMDGNIQMRNGDRKID